MHPKKSGVCLKSPIGVRTKLADPSCPVLNNYSGRFIPEEEINYQTTPHEDKCICSDCDFHSLQHSVFHLDPAENDMIKVKKDNEFVPYDRKTILESPFSLI
jgi:hypothetical protein